MVISLFIPRWAEIVPLIGLIGQVGENAETFDMRIRLFLGFVMYLAMILLIKLPWASILVLFGLIGQLIN